MHGVEDAPVDGLEAVAHIGQGARNDHAHGVIEVRGAHLIVDIYLLNCSNFHIIVSILVEIEGLLRTPIGSFFGGLISGKI